MFALVFLTGVSQAQIISLEEQVKIELQKRGLEYEEVKEALFLRGYDLENTEDLSSAQVEDIRNIITFLTNQKALERESEDQIRQIDSLPSLDGVDSRAEAELYPIDSLGFNEEVVDIFGHHLYRGGQFQLVEPSEDLIAPIHYLIGVGDEIVVSIFGRSAQLDEEYLVQSDGSIFVNDGRAKIYLSGLTIDEARRKLIGNFQRFMIFRNDEFALRIKASKTVRVEIFGEVISPGSYVVSSLNSVFSAITAAAGPNPDASLRSIRLIKANGDVELFDLYEWIVDPVNFKPTYLENGDVIHVPISTSRVEIQGRVRRPMLYDLLEEEGIKTLISYAGGLASDAYVRTFQLIRQDGTSRNALDIDYLEITRTDRDYILKDGDVVRVAAISEEIENYVRVNGEVRNPGDYERTRGMRISDLIRKSELKESSKTDLIYLIRRSNDGRVEMVSIDADFILNNPSSPQNLNLRNKDELVIYAKERYTDEEYVIIGGAVRFPDTLLFDVSQNLRIRDYITLAGGLEQGAASFAHVHRINPLNPSEKEYMRVDLERVFNMDNAIDNINLLPYDSVYVYFREDFTEESTINVSGAVNVPGSFQYGVGMTLADAIIMAGGFKLSSATNDIELSRVIMEANQPTKIQINKVKVERDISELARSDSDIVLQPFDYIYVREVPEFELQQNVILEGEVRFPGEYSLVKSNETLYDLIQRAGGITEEAFPAAAQLYRNEDSLGYVVIRLDEVLKNPNSIYNSNLKNGDFITIPKKKDYVTIRGATRAIDAVDRDILGPNNEINVPYHAGETAKFYIDYYAGGFAPRADKKKVFVRHPNGEVRQFEKKFLAAKYPEVRQGSVISVGYKEAIQYAGDEDKKVDWTKVLGDSVGQAMSILTLILLVERLD